MAARVVILGGGVGGTLLANLLACRLRGRAEVTVVDSTGMHVYQPGYLYVALDEADARWLTRDERRLLRKEVELVVEEAVHVDASAGLVRLARGGSLPYDYLVLATGSRIVREEVPGLSEGAHDFYSLDGAQRLREALRRFKGGKIVVGVAGLPYKCPPAPVEFVLMLHDYLSKRGVREKTEIHFLSPLNRAFTIESASRLVQPIMEAKGIVLHTFVNVESVDASKGELLSLEGEVFPFDLAVLVPPHRGAAVVEKSGLGEDGGWVPVDRHTLRVAGAENVFALGDATNLPISKSGSTAHFEVPVVAEQIVAEVEGRAPTPGRAIYSGKVTCFLETGGGRATILQFDYENPPRPPRPSFLWHAAKWAFNRAYWYLVPDPTKTPLHRLTHC